MKMADRKYQEAKKVHNIAGILANRCHMDIDDVYTKIIWPLAQKFESTYNAFLLSVTYGCSGWVMCRNPEVMDNLEIEDSVRDELINMIKVRMAPQPKKVRADVEVTCFSIHGVDGIRAAMVCNCVNLFQIVGGDREIDFANCRFSSFSIIITLAFEWDANAFITSVLLKKLERKVCPSRLA